jgi:hypothetical protein
MQAKTTKYYLFFATLLTFNFTGCTSPIPTVQPRHYQLQQAQVQQPKVTPVEESQITPIKEEEPSLTPTPSYEKPTAKKLAQYEKTMRSVASGIKNDSTYQRIVLNTAENKHWFKDLTYKLWDRQITRQDFLQQGLAKYPTHQYELQFIIDGFSKHS